MRLKKSTEQNFTTEFEILDDSNNWVEGFCGRFAPVDRFLSNFHRPMQRRMLHSPVDYDLPDSRVVRNTTSGDIYILGQSRSDDENGEVYTKITVAHLVSNASSGLATLKRMVVDGARPDSTIGELIDSTVGQFYISVEYKTSIENFGTDEVFEDRFIVYASHALSLEPDDSLELNGKVYIVNSPYHDSDYACAVVTREPEDRVTGTYRKVKSTYDTTTGAVTPVYEDYLVTCVVNTYKGELKMGDRYGVSSDVEVYLKSPSFPILPRIGDHFHVNAESFIVRGVSQDQEAGYQWRLMCERHNP